MMTIRVRTGLTEAKLVKALAPEIAKCIFGEPTDIEISKIEAGIELFPVRGYWTHNHQDVQKFTGRVVVGSSINYDIGSWESMTACLRKGFRLIDNRGDDRSYSNFECVTLD